MRPTNSQGRRQSNAGASWPYVDLTTPQRQVLVQVIYDLRHRTYLESKLNNLGIAAKSFFEY